MKYENLFKALENIGLKVDESLKPEIIEALDKDCYLRLAAAQFLGFGIGYTCEINDLISGMGLSINEWQQLKDKNELSTLMGKHIRDVDSLLTRPEADKTK